MPDTRRPGSPNGRRSSFGLLRLLLTVLLVGSFSGLSHAAAEVVENVVHVADTGHEAHTDEHPDGCGEGPEHFCFGAVHNCGCCPTACAASSGSAALPADSIHRLTRDPLDDDLVQDGIRPRVDRPPRR